MIGSSTLSPLLLSLVASAAAATDPRPAASQPEQGILLAQVTVHERIIIRVPRIASAGTTTTTRRAAPPPETEWKEKSGPKCVRAADMAGALITTPDAVDLVMTGGKRLRARLDADCRPLDFYSGFYLKPATDGKICASRDAIRTRSGATCPIAAFRELRANRHRH